MFSTNWRSCTAQMANVSPLVKIAGADLRCATAADPKFPGLAALQREVARAKSTELKDRKKLAKEVSKWCDIALADLRPEQLQPAGQPVGQPEAAPLIS